MDPKLVWPAIVGAVIIAFGTGHYIGWHEGRDHEKDQAPQWHDRNLPAVPLPEQSRQAPSGSFGNPDGSLKWEGD